MKRLIHTFISGFWLHQIASSVQNFNLTNLLPHHAVVCVCGTANQAVFRVQNDINYDNLAVDYGFPFVSSKSFLPPSVCVCVSEWVSECIVFKFLMKSAFLSFLLSEKKNLIIKLSLNAYEWQNVTDQKSAGQCYKNGVCVLESNWDKAVVISVRCGTGRGATVWSRFK